jgi:hypothetical protein
MAIPESWPFGTLEDRLHGLGYDRDAASRVSDRVEAYLTGMLRRLGLDIEPARERFPLELMAAEGQCALCEQTARCRRFLTGATRSDAPEAFCPNTHLFRALRRHL